MFKELLICAVVSACAACTSASQPRPDAKTADATQQPCALPSGSRIPAKPGQCSPFPGRSYSQQDINRTGQSQVGDALPMLDPSITVHH